MTPRSRSRVLAALLAALTGCGAPRDAPVGPGPVPTKTDDLPTARTPSNLVDSGTFVMFVEGKAVGREEFTIRRSGANLVIASKTTSLDPDRSFASEGELEVDAQFRPLRATYRSASSSGALTYLVGGSPLTLDITGDDGRDPQHFVAPRTIDVLLHIPGTIAMSALCRASGDILWSTFALGAPPFVDAIEAYVAQPVGAAKRVVRDIGDRDEELVCDGDKLVAGWIPDFEIWFAREGSEAHLDALKAAPRPEKHAWKKPQDPTQPWAPHHTWLFDTGVLVTQDGRRRVMRLTSLDVKTGAEIKHREFALALGTHVMCEPLPKARLICEIDELGFLRVLDARTLEDQQDLAPLLHKTVKGSERAHLMFHSVKNEQVDVLVNGEKLVRLDVAKGTAAFIAIPKQHDYLGTLDGALCSSTGKDGPFKGSRLLACRSERAATFALSYDGDKSALARVGRGNTVVWQTVLGAHPADVRTHGDLLLVTTTSEARRVIAIDSKTGAIKWVAAGPQPTKP